MPAAAVELEDPARDVVEEVAIVGDRDDGALVLGEVALEPRDRLGVEVVRGLVEQQQVGRREQQPAERDAAALAAARASSTSASAGGRRSASIAYSSCVSRFHASAASICACRRGELVGGLVGVVGGELVEAVEQRARLGDAVLDVAAHVLGLVELRLLLEQADGRVGRELRVAAELGVAPGHDLAAASTCRRRCSRARRSSRRAGTRA